jgi:hypothetical protein
MRFWASPCHLPLNALNNLSASNNMDNIDYKVIRWVILHDVWLQRIPINFVLDTWQWYSCWSKAKVCVHNTQMLHTFPEHEVFTTDFLLYNLQRNQCMNILHATWRSLIMLQIDHLKNQTKFDEIVHLVRPIYTRNQRCTISLSFQEMMELLCKFHAKSRRLRLWNKDWIMYVHKHPVNKGEKRQSVFSCPLLLRPNVL